MTTWLCRLMAAVFTLNILAPTDLLAQTRSAAPRAPRLSQPAPVLSAEEIRAQVEEKFQDKVSAAQKKYEEAKGVHELYAAVKNLHAVMTSRTAENKRRQADADKRREAERAMQARYTQPAGSTYVAPRIAPLPVEARPNFNEFAAKLNNGEMDLSDLILHLDPLEGGNLMNTVFAAEILGNSVDAMGQNGEEQTQEMADFLLELQLRAMYRLQSLSANKENSSSYLMALGSLRLLLLKANSFFERAGMPNPLFEAADSKPAPAKQLDLVRVKELDGRVMWVSKRPAKGSSSATKQAPKPLFTKAMYGKLMNDVMAEIRAYKEQDLSETDAEYSKLILSLEYAVSYAMDFDPSQVPVMVKLFDRGPKKTDFKQQYSGVLNAIFTSVFENVKFTPGNDKHTQAINMFLEFSDPEKYSIPTRIFALEMASLLYRPYNAETLAAKNVNQEAGNSVLSSFFVVNTSPVNPDLRPVFAARTADIYCPLTYTHYLAMKDYGLDSDQMQALADKLAYIYDGFYDISTPTISMPGQDPHHWSSKCHIAMKNRPNEKKRNDEIMWGFTLFVGEALLWVFGGEIIGVAWRVTRGTMVALPKAVRAAAAANKGRRALSFGIEIKKGVRYANLASTTRLNGITVTATRVEEVRKPAAAAANAAGAGSASAAAPANALRLAPPPVTAAAPGTPLLSAAPEAAATASKPGWWDRVRSWWNKKSYTMVEEPVTSSVASMRDFRNSRGWWRGSRAPVEKWDVVIQEPGFNGRMATLAGPRAARLRNGIQNYDDWRYLMRNSRMTMYEVKMEVAQPLLGSNVTVARRFPVNPFESFTSFMDRVRMTYGNRIIDVKVINEGGMLNFTTPLKPWRSLWQGMWKPMFLGSQSSAAGVVQQEQRIMGATGRAFAKDAQKGVGEGVFDYWKYTENGWVRINQKQFMELGGGLQTAAKEAVPDYYAFMGVGRDASTQEIKRAYKRLSIKLHPDRGGSEELMAQLNLAWDTLGDDVARAAYDAKLLAAPKNVSAVVLPESPEGMSLAITRNMGRDIPAGFSPLTETAQGVGFNAANWGAVEVQLSKHLAATGQTSVLQPTLAMSNPFIVSAKGNLAFFGSWIGLDQVVNPFMQDWMTSTSTEEIGKMQKKHGDAYDPALLAEDQQFADEALREAQALGYNTASPSTYETVNGAQRQSAVGALISFPFLSAWQEGAKTGVGQLLGLKSPFDSEQTRTLLQIGADRIQAQRMVRKYQNVKTQKDFDAFYNGVVTVSESLKTRYLQGLAQISQMPGVGNLSAERQKIVSYFDSVKRSAEQIANGNGDMNKKGDEITRLWTSVEAKLPEFDDILFQKSVAPEGEKAFFRDIISLYQEKQEDYVRNLWAMGNIQAIGKAEKIFRDAVDEIRKAQKKKATFSVKYQAVMAAGLEMNRKLTALSQGAPKVSSATQETMTVQQLRDKSLLFIDSMETQAQAQGLQTGDFFQQWREEVTNYCNDSTYTIETLRLLLDIVTAAKMEELDELISNSSGEQPSAGSASPAAKTGALSSEELNELLPDETSEISTGA